MRQLSLIILIMLCGVCLRAQTEPNCPNYKIQLEQGDAYFKASQYLEALKAYQSAAATATTCGISLQVTDLKIQQLFIEIETQRRNSKISSDSIRQALHQADSILSKNESLLNKLYFYKDSFGLAVESDAYRKRYGYIDKQGQVRLPYEYSFATPFDEATGFAKVKMNRLDFNRRMILPDTDYLINTEGEAYLVAYKLEDLADNEIEALDLREVDLDSFPISILAHLNLKVLILDRQKFGDGYEINIPAQISQLKQLEYLSAQYCRINQLPESIGQLKNLRVLYLSGNELNVIPDSIGQLKNLRDLRLDGNQLNSIPESIGQLSNLKDLELSYNQLRSIPDNIGQLINLQGLYLNKNQLRSIPKSIGQISSLRDLFLHDNQLTNLLESIGQLSNLHRLYMYDNKLTNLPESIVQLSSLTELYLWENQLRRLPENIGQLRNIKQLGLHMNQLSTLPESIGQLVNIKVLNLAMNQLSALPESISQLRNIEKLGLSENQLFTLPKSIGQMSKLRELTLGNNPNLPQSEIDKIKLALPNCGITN